MNTYLLMITFRVWFLELAVTALNYFVLMRRVYEPRVGELRAHQIGMTTRIVYIFAFAYLILSFVPSYSNGDLIIAGLFWMVLILLFEWGGSMLQRRPVHEILVGWHVNRGYLWPFVLLTYLFAPLVVGLLLLPSGIGGSHPPVGGGDPVVAVRAAGMRFERASGRVPRSRPPQTHFAGEPRGHAWESPMPSP